MRISNFYKTNIGNMVPETFYCAKEKRFIPWRRKVRSSLTRRK
jgi:hypothetical protein